MDRVVVVGAPGAGKTTTATLIAERVAAPRTEMDALWWEPGWHEVGRDILRERVAPVVANERWVIDGNYFSATADLVWARADTIVWLDLPRWLTVSRVVKRTFVRWVRRTELWDGNYESLRLSLGRDSIIWFAWREHAKYRARYEPLSQNGEYPHITWVRLQSPKAVREWLAQLRP